MELFGISNAKSEICQFRQIHTISKSKECHTQHTHTTERHESPHFKKEKNKKCSTVSNHQEKGAEKISSPQQGAQIQNFCAVYSHMLEATLFFFQAQIKNVAVCAILSSKYFIPTYFNV